MKAWQVCEECGDDWCNLHGQHAKDCPCPMHHEWEADPLASETACRGFPMVAETVAEVK